MPTLSFRTVVAFLMALYIVTMTTSTSAVIVYDVSTLPLLSLHFIQMLKYRLGYTETIIFYGGDELYTEEKEF